MTRIEQIILNKEETKLYDDFCEMVKKIEKNTLSGISGDMYDLTYEIYKAFLNENIIMTYEETSEK